MIRLIISFILLLSIGFSETGNQMKSPTAGAFDFAYENNLSNSIQNFKPETTLDKVLVQIGKQNVTSRREKNIFSCMTDAYGSTYCPAALAPANKYSTFKESTVVERTNTVIDYEKGNWQEKTSWVRDFLNGTSAPHVNTETNYTNGYSASYVGNVIDYVDRTTSNQYFCPSDGYLLARSDYDTCPSCTDVPRHDVICYLNGTLKLDVYSVWRGTNTRAYDFATRTISTTEISSNQGSVFIGDPGEGCNFPLYYSRTCNGSTCDHNFQLSGSTCNGRDYTSVVNAAIPYREIYGCPDNTYQYNGSNCQKNVSYNYYSYGCPNGFSPQNVGFTTFTKSDPNTSLRNDYMLDDDVNSPTPPANNCVQVLNSVAYEYLCTSGYNPITPGLTSCPAGTSGNCNNPAPPAANCYKDISYKHYTYGCSPGYVTDNYGLATCTKTDPDTTRNNSDTLADACNSPTPPDGNCKKTYSYKFYEYQCNGTNSFNEQWKATNSGLTSCTKTDTNINTVNADLSTACNSSTAPSKNCVAPEYNCGEGDGGIFLKDNTEYANGSSTRYSSTITSYLSKINVANIMQCPNGSIETTGTEREKGECKTETPYSYYSYSCPTDTNQYGFTYIVQNAGGNCNATNIEQLMDTNNDGIKDSCNSPTPPVNNCVRKSYNAIAGINSPVFVDNQWQCSPFSCNSNKKCGYGLCPYGTTPSDTLFQDAAYNPLGASYNGTCIGEICDYVRNNKISYCVSKQCPTGPEYVTKDGNCYKEECPQGTFMSGSKCISSSY